MITFSVIITKHNRSTFMYLNINNATIAKQNVATFPIMFTFFSRDFVCYRNSSHHVHVLKIRTV